MPVGSRMKIPKGAIKGLNPSCNLTLPKKQELYSVNNFFLLNLQDDEILHKCYFPIPSKQQRSLSQGEIIQYDPLL